MRGVHLAKPFAFFLFAFVCMRIVDRQIYRKAENNPELRQREQTEWHRHTEALSLSLFFSLQQLFMRHRFNGITHFMWWQHLTTPVYPLNNK